MIDNGLSFEHDKLFSFHQFASNHRSFFFFLRVELVQSMEEIKSMNTVENDAINAFHDLFLDKTGNQWTERGNFQKLPNKHYPLEIDYGQHEDSGRNSFNVLI